MLTIDLYPTSACGDFEIAPLPLDENEEAARTDDGTTPFGGSGPGKPRIPDQELSGSPGDQKWDGADLASTAPKVYGARVGPPWGKPLSDEDYAALDASWIDREAADAAFLRRVDAYEGREVVGQKGNRDCAGILIPYYWPGEPRPFNYRLRRDHPDWKQNKDGKVKPDRKYLGPPNGSNRLYIPPGVTPAQLADINIPIIIVEGEKKALALWKLARLEADTPRFIPIAIAGVWNWRGNVGKANGPRGDRVDVMGPIPDLARLRWDKRKTLILYDVNVHTNDNVKLARKGIARELATRGGEVEFINLPEDCGVNGVDDLLADWGPQKVLELFEKPVDGLRREVVLPPQFQVKPEGMFRTVQKGEQLSETQLTNFRASVKTSIILDDGVETKREFEIEAELVGRRFQFTIPASEFAGMEWTIQHMGPTAITYPNQRDYARTAIQSFSLMAEERHTYTHTGWRKVGGHWLYLHGAGAIGAAGAVAGMDIRLCGALSRFELRPPQEAAQLARAVRSSLLLADLGPPSVSLPLRSLTCRAIFGACDFSGHLAGETGAFKSELAALEQQHFGAGMNRLNLPGTWCSTGNALEILTFHAKDSLVVIDDFAPQGSVADVGRYHAAADRVFRAVGNHSGRGRLDSTAKLREAKPPRALVLSTGEDIPRGHSIRARLLILEIAKGAINSGKLTECQKHAESGLYAEATAGFVQWIAERYEEIQAYLKRRTAELRSNPLGVATHARTPEIIANLQAAFELYIEFAEKCGAISHTQAEVLIDRCWKALIEAAAAQEKHQAATEPTGRFLSLLRGCLSSGRAHIATRTGTKPDGMAESCGWRHYGGNWEPLGDCIGWLDHDDLYLEPSTAFRVVQNAGRDNGETLAISEQTLKKRLRERGLLASTDVKRETLTVRRTIAGCQQDVLHFFTETLLPKGPDKTDNHTSVAQDRSQ